MPYYLGFLVNTFYLSVSLVTGFSLNMCSWFGGRKFMDLEPMYHYDRWPKYPVMGNAT